MKNLSEWQIMLIAFVAFPFIAILGIWWTVTVVKFLSGILPGF